MPERIDREQARDALRVLREFCADVEAQGGVVPVGGGLFGLAGDEEWVDLAETYLKACQVLSRHEMIAE